MLRAVVKFTLVNEIDIDCECLYVLVCLCIYMSFVDSEFVPQRSMPVTVNTQRIRGPWTKLSA